MHADTGRPTLSHQPVELVVHYCLQTTIKFSSVTENSGGSIHHPLQPVSDRLR